MLIKRLVWETWSDEEAIEHQILNPSWEAIQHAFTQLDGQTHPILLLSLQDRVPYYPLLTIIGGPDKYTLTLERQLSQRRGTFERIQFINIARFQQFGASGYRSIGKGYHNYEIENAFLTSDTGRMLATIQHFFTSTQWHPHMPFIVEAEDEGGEWLEYVD